MRRTLIAAILIALLTRTDAIANDVFGNGHVFPGPNPETADLLPDADPDTSFGIGQMMFEYRINLFGKDVQAVNDLSMLHSVSDTVKKATPSPAITAIVDQQLSTPHEFHFVSATVSSRGDSGLTWDVTYELFPKVGGFSGVPYRYRALLDGHGNLISPQLTLFDAFFHSTKEGWTCCILRIPTSPTAKDAALSAEKIREIATESLADRTKAPNAADTARSRMKYDSQKIIRIPCVANPMGAPEHVNIWAVSFRDPVQKEDPGERLTVWVTESGRAADVRHLDHYWDAE
jgi:hypothetical protein